ncbi:hypothetical protein J6L97_09580 [Lactobacillus crispatus]|uniref:EpsG family protein n=1 Tax=Lactobacillus crispatus TaxID=47770 RepID=A0A5M9YZZ5_9LACO|nr:hypothetical protein [Lactobacillus crispatus]KAA8812060.1 hypothetical protein F1C09_08010 [Lactobacillus crispatus]KRK35697.1 hypothetical protein FC28_GL001417 [Lactobacillus crispatus DSM 20584 = JCM 1185 = ATCC 33820]MBW9142363.1 hypothetical protein [Lactobacillus crispatus]ORE87706.1 hypothetical protein B6C82_01815 [Lactobacillus crispatus]QWW28779.1 hypothetical protein J6L97_09580 [Lactobacillus crispatus]
MIFNNFGSSYISILIVTFLISSLWIHLKYVSPCFLYFLDILIAIPAYFINTAIPSVWDSVRFATMLNLFRGANNIYGISGGLNWALNSSGYYPGQPVVVVYVWLYSFFRNNNVFFYCNILLFLFLMSLLIIQVQKIYKFSNKISLIVKFIILMSFNIFFEIEGVRNFLSYIILATFVFIDFNSYKFRTKILCILAYCLAIGLHPAALPFVLFRIIFILKSKLIRMVLAVCAATYTVLLPQILQLFSSFTYFINDDSKTYLFGQTTYNAYSDFPEILFSTLLLVSLILELLIFCKCNFKKLISKNYLQYYMIAILFTIGSCLSVQVYLRSIFLLLFLSIPIKMFLFSEYKNNILNYSIIYFYKYSSVIFSLIMLFYWNWQTYRHVVMC